MRVEILKKEALAALDAIGQVDAVTRLGPLVEAVEARPRPAGAEEPPVS
jgi:hypothetical protein